MRKRKKAKERVGHLLHQGQDFLVSTAKSERHLLAAALLLLNKVTLAVHGLDFDLDEHGLGNDVASDAIDEHVGLLELHENLVHNAA